MDCYKGYDPPLVETVVDLVSGFVSPAARRVFRDFVVPQNDYDKKGLSLSLPPSSKLYRCDEDLTQVWILVNVLWSRVHRGRGLSVFRGTSFPRGDDPYSCGVS